MNAAEFSNPYDVLGVSAGSSHEEIKRSYQRLVLQVGKLMTRLAKEISLFNQLDLEISLQVHPDKLDESLTQEDRDKAYEKFLAIDKAWKLLKNQETRVNIDKQLKEQALSQEWPVSAEVDLDDMEYHEDSGSFSSVCRCSGEYVITECDLENGHNTVCCSNCTFSIRVLYNVLADGTSDDHQEMANS